MYTCRPYLIYKQLVIYVGWDNALKNIQMRTLHLHEYTHIRTYCIEQKFDGIKL